MVSPHHQYSLTLIQREVNNSVISQRSEDGYINATALCAAANKTSSDYFKEDATRQFLDALSIKTKIPRQTLVQEVGPKLNTSSVWVHPKVAIHLGQWLSADFAVQVSEWVYEWMSGIQPHTSPRELPPHLNRYLQNDSKVPQGYFSILQETSLSLFGPLYNLGFDIPRDWVPDISVGKLFCAWLRDELGVDTASLPTYSHDYLDDRKPVQAKVYPERLLPDFRTWFRNCWLPEYGVKYFRRKDPGSLTYLDKLPALSSPTQSKRLRP